MESLICRAIGEKRLLEIRYRGEQRVVVPHVLYETKAGNTLLHGHIDDVSFDEDGTTHWCNLRLDEIDTAKALDLYFEYPQPGYNPSSSLFHKIICRV